MTDALKVTDCQRVFTTNPGLEKVVIAEFRQRCYAAGAPAGGFDARRSGVRGRVLAGTDGGVMAAVAPRMRSIHHVRRPVDRFDLPDGPDPLAAIAARVAQLDLPEMATAASFRASCIRRGDQPFTSEDVMRAVGATLNRVWQVPVDLTGYDVAVHVDVIESRCIVDVVLPHQALSNRHPRVETHPTGLRANIAYAALRMAGIEEDSTGRVLDPFCGSGTILLEAGDLAPGIEVVGCDWNERAAAGAEANLAQAGLGGRGRVECRDSLAGLDDLGAFDAVVTNPPFGRKLGRGMKFPDFYRRLFELAADRLAPGHRLVFLADRGGAVNRGQRAAGGFRLRRRRLIQMSGVWPCIYVFERL